jgi:PAS domain S-box-containing protein
MRTAFCSVILWFMVLIPGHWASLAADAAGSVPVNGPVSFHEQHPAVLWGAGCIFALLLGLVVLWQRKNRVERALRESEERYRIVADNTYDWEYWASPQGQFLYVSPSCQRISGYSAEAYLKRPDLWRDIILPEDQPKWDAHSCVATRGQLAEEFDLRIRRADGAVCWIRHVCIPVFDSQGSFLGSRGSNRDVTERMRMETALRESEVRFRLLYEKAPLPYQSLDEDGNFIEVNQAFMDALGYARAEVIGRNFGEFLAPDWGEHFKQNFPRFKAVGEILGVEFEMVKKDGSRILVSFNGKIARDDQGRFRQTHCIFTDITERTRAVATLQASEERYRMLFEEMTAAFALHEMIFDESGMPCDYKFLRVNPAFERLTGLSAGDVVGRRVTEVIPGIEDHWIARYGKVVLTGAPEQFEDYSRQLEKYFDVRAFRPGPGQFAVVFQDVTSRMKTEAALRESEEKYRRLVENAMDAIFITQDGVIKFPNPKTVEWFGLDPEKLKTVAFETFIHPDDRAAVMDRYRRRLAGENISLPSAYRVKNRKGQEFWVQVSTVLIEWEGRPASLSFVRDISSQKKLEDQLAQAQKMEAIGSLAGGIAHDFNNILSVIIGNSEILEQTGAVEISARDSLNQIMAASQRAKQLVKQILAFSRHARQEKIIIDLKPIVKETMEFLRSSLPATIQLKYYLDPNAGLILADPTQMQQVLMNLCANSGHAMEPEGGVLEIDLRKVELAEEDVRFESEMEAGWYVRLIVSDTGHGIDAIILQRIFEPYFTTKEPGKGTGLGLSVVHGIVKSHGGKIKVNSEVGKGTTFTMFFPHAMGFEKVEDQPLQPLSMGTERILFVDDEEALTDLGRKILGKLGYQVETRTSPIEALEAFRANPKKFDLVITDMTMPQMTGLNLARKIMEIRPGMPIILCTGFSEQAKEQAAGAMGIRAFLYKPLLMRDIADAVRKALNPNMSDMQ